MNRRTVLKLSGLALTRHALAFETTLKGWIDIENSTYSLPGGHITQPGAFIYRIVNGNDSVTGYIRSHLQEGTKQELVNFSMSEPTAQARLSQLGKEISHIMAGPSIYEQVGASGTSMRPETLALARRNPTGLELARLNRLFLEDAFPTELAKSNAIGWIVKDGVFASTGVGRGVLYTANDYTRFRFSFSVRHVSGDPDHQPCVLIFCTRPKPNEIPLDALGGIQFQPPNGGHWDYRPGMNNNGGTEFMGTKGTFDPSEWNKVEIDADATRGEAQMTVNGREVMKFKDPSAGKPGPVALQMHNQGLYDEYKDLSIHPA